MISAKVECVDVNDFFTSLNSQDFSFFPNPFSLGMLVTCWGVGVHFFCIWVGYLRFFFLTTKFLCVIRFGRVRFLHQSSLFF
jgi:hypothetical protein